MIGNEHDPDFFCSIAKTDYNNIPNKYCNPENGFSPRFPFNQLIVLLLSFGSFSVGSANKETAFWRQAQDMGARASFHQSSDFESTN